MRYYNLSSSYVGFQYGLYVMQESGVRTCVDTTRSRLVALFWRLRYEGADDEHGHRSDNADSNS